MRNRLNPSIPTISPDFWACGCCSALLYVSELKARKKLRTFSQYVGSDADQLESNVLPIVQMDIDAFLHRLKT